MAALLVLLPHLATGEQVGIGSGVHDELPLPPWAYGIIAFGILLALLGGLLVFGRGRRHS